MFRAYYANEKWDCLRVMGWPDNYQGQVLERAMLTFTPLMQSSPLMDPNDPLMLDRVMGQILGDHQTLRYYGKLRNPCFRCNMLEIEPHDLGNHVKYLLRCSNDSYPELLTDVPAAPDLHSESHEGLNRLKDLSTTPFLDVQAYDEQLIVAGESPFEASEYWPAGYPVKRESSSGIDLSWWIADSIQLPITVSDEHLGRLLQRVWMAHADFPYPPPPELEEFWQRIKD